MSDKRLQAIKERLEAATPGPWRYQVDRVVAGEYTIVVECDEEYGPITEPQDAEFIANAPSDIAYLLEQLEVR